MVGLLRVVGLYIHENRVCTNVKGKTRCVAHFHSLLDAMNEAKQNWPSMADFASLRAHPALAAPAFGFSGQ
ncbi:MAG: hypothetical protein ACTHOC_12750 [Luteimonas sp.]